MTGNFNPTYSTNDIWRDEEMARCLTLDIEDIEADITALQCGKADSNHTHTGYASTTHTHPEYAAADHEHDDYALSTHTHDDVVTLTKLTNIMSTHHDMTLTATAGENYSAVSGSATLVGNMLRVRLNATRNSAVSGNIDNETEIYKSKLC